MATAGAAFAVLVCAVCMLRDPALFKHPHWGLSFYGDQRQVLLPYYGGLAIIISCFGRITQLLWPLVGPWRPLRGVFLATTLIALGIGATSSMQGAFLFWTHISFSLALALLLLPAEVWILHKPGANWLDYIGAAGLLAGTVLVNLSADWSGVLGIYYWAEVVFFLAAFLALGRAATRAAAGL